MYEYTLTGLNNLVNSAFGKEDAEYMILWVEGVTPAPEVIINVKANFEDKMSYYNEAYNEDLTLKANDTIKVTKYALVTSEELQELITKMP